MSDSKWIKDFSPKHHLTAFSFDDLDFKPHPLISGALQATGNINGKWYSVVGGGFGLYGDGLTTWEYWDDNLDDPVGYITSELVSEYLKKLQE